MLEIFEFCATMNVICTQTMKKRIDDYNVMIPTEIKEFEILMNR